MREFLKVLVKSAMAKTPFRIVRAPPNRFQAIEECLGHLKKLGYRPKLIIDGGAHLGDFSRMATVIFPGASIHMIEPQPACHDILKEVAARCGHKVHFVALVSDAEAGNSVAMAAGTEPSTGAYIVPLPDRLPTNVLVETSTLDRIFASIVSPVDRILLKLDLQGYEMIALNGSIEVLKSVEFVLTEVSFFAQAYEPSIAQLVAFFDENGFELFDIAAMSARARDNRLKQGDLLFVKKGTSLAKDTSWA